MLTHAYIRDNSTQIHTISLRIVTFVFSPIRGYLISFTTPQIAIQFMCFDLWCVFALDPKTGEPRIKEEHYWPTVLTSFLCV